MHSIRAKGFTLVELMIVITVLAVLTAIAVPSFQSSMRSNRVATGTNELMASLALARTEAIRSRRGGGICATEDGESCAEDGVWDNGWLVWTDANGDGEKAEGEPVIRYVEAKQKMVVSGSAGTIAFDARGRATSGAQDIDLKAEGDGEHLPERCVSVSVTGQIKVTREACS